MTNPTPQVEECDRDRVQNYLYDNQLSGAPLLLKHFAAHRHSAVAVLRAEIEAAWQIIESSYDIEPRKQLESEAKKNGFKYGLAQAVFYLWKRDANVAAAVAKREAEIVGIIENSLAEWKLECKSAAQGSTWEHVSSEVATAIGGLLDKLQTGGGA